LSDSVEALEAKINILTGDIGLNAGTIARLDSEIATRTQTRAEEKKENEATMKDGQDAQTAVAQAIAVLEDFYKENGDVAKEAWEPAFVETKATVRRQQPDTWSGGASRSGTDGGADVIGMLSEIATDFSEMESKARSDETTQQGEFDEWITTSQVEKSKSTKANEMMSSEKDRKDEKLESKNGDTEHNNGELASTQKYMNDLDHACVDGDSTYGDRKAARTTEAEALRTAQGILETAFNPPAESSD